MYDTVTSGLIAGAPALAGLEPADLREELTAAYVEIAAARLSLNQVDDPFSPELTQLLRRMARLADAYEARIVLDLDRDRRRSTAFVAASARQLIALAARLRNPEASTSRLDEDAVGADIASALLFLIAERSSDAFEVARDVQAAGEPDPIRRALILSVGRLARGRLQDIITIDLASERLVATGTFGHAADLLFRELLAGVILLAQDGLGLADADGIAAAVDRFENVRRLAIDIEEDTPAPAGLRAISAFPGPYHLAGLLIQAAGTLRDSALVRTPSPGGAKAESWAAWLREEAARWPYVWENHRRAIATGYLDCGQSLVMTSPTGSGKTTLAALKIASTITSGKTVLYLAPTHALVSQVERDLNERVSGLATAESVDDTTVEDILPALPTLAVVTPERCFALLTFAPQLFANVGLLVFDECHLLGMGQSDDGTPPRRVDRRGVDAMLCLLTFLSTTPHADLLLLSAMVSNGPEVAAWLQSLTGRPVHPFDDRWKPTRQLRCCVTYDAKELQASRTAANTRGGKPAGTPLGVFSLVSGWNPGAPDKLLLRPLSPTPIALNVGGKNVGRRYVTANRFEVAARIAGRFERAGLKVIIFCDSIPTCVSTAKHLNAGQDGRAAIRDAEQEAWRGAAIAELGGVEGIYDAGECRAAVHHGELLPDERRLVESLFRNRESGVNVLAATSTLAQGLNLPCEVVILAGTDRVDESDPTETKRSPLAAHEILNALGRAGRAGLSATGLALVVPGQLIGCDPVSKRIEPNEDLPIIFAEGDQCLPLRDPLTTLFDQVEVAGVSEPEATYLLRRVAILLGPDADAGAFDGLARRTFGFHTRLTRDAATAEAWLVQRRAVLTAAIQATAEPPALPWEEELAAKTGATRRFIAGLAAAYPTAPSDALDAEPWIDWVLDRFDPEMDDVDAFLRPDTMIRVFGRAYSNRPGASAKRRLALAGVKTVLKLWFAGESLLRMEAAIADFIAAHEIEVKQPTRADARAKRARRFSLRLAPDLGFLCGVLGQVAAKHEAEAGKMPPPMLQFLPQLVRRGYATPYHFALSRTMPNLSRAEVHQTYGAVAPHLQRSSGDDWNTIQDKLSDARIKLAFSDFSFEDSDIATGSQES